MGQRGLGLMAVLLAAMAAGSQGAPLRIAAADDLPAQAAEGVLREAYRRLGLEMRLELMPLRRARHLLQRGELDAELLRAPVYFDSTPEALRVDAVVVELGFWAHRRKPCPMRVTVDELRQLRVVYPRGVAVIETLLPPQALVPAAWGSDMFQMLLRGRADYSLSLGTPAALAVQERQAPELCRVPEPVLMQKLYHALHRRHAELAPRLAKVLRQLHAEGLPQRLLAEQEAKLLSGPAE